MSSIRILHVSDIHFGRNCLFPMVEGIEGEIAKGTFDVVAFSGDLTQRAWKPQLARGAAFLARAARHAQVISVPGNHDVEWWWSPMHLFGERPMYRKYRAHVDAELEPVLRVPGATFVGLNSAHGVSARTLTRRPRDISIIGDLRWQQVEWAHNEFLKSPLTDARVIVMHHNLLRGELSQRFGFHHPQQVRQWLEQSEVDLVLCGHDHQEAVAGLTHPKGTMVVSTAGTVSNRSRGQRPQSVHVVTITPNEISVGAMIWSEADSMLKEGPVQSFTRH